MTNEEIKCMAEKAGVRFFGGWIEGSQAAIYKFAELVVSKPDGVDYCLWPDGTWCERDEVEEMNHMSDDYIVLSVTDWDDDGAPIFPGGLV